MRIIVNGVTGKMGQIVKSMAQEGYANSTFVAGVSPDLEKDQGNLHQSFETCSEEADAVIDFSFHAGVKSLLDFCILRKLPVVIATTGHTEEEKELIALAAKTIPVFYSANMSMGVAVLAETAKRVVAAFPEADVEIIETHHNRKLDVPSGTALLLADSIKTVRPNATYNIGRSQNGKREKNEIGIHSIRMGNICGIHEIHINTGNEELVLRHQAFTRDIFAEGAFKAATFILHKNSGLYDMKSITT